LREHIKINKQGLARFPDCVSRTGERVVAIANFHCDRRPVGRSAQHLVKNEAMNRLYFGDNLKWLSDRKEFPDASADLVYLDPPFNSSRADM
jgi:16S rRNA G966 N2-methylase RsmD